LSCQANWELVICDLVLISKLIDKWLSLTEMVVIISLLHTQFTYLISCKLWFASVDEITKCFQIKQHGSHMRAEATQAILSKLVLTFESGWNPIFKVGPFKLELMNSILCGTVLHRCPCWFCLLRLWMKPQSSTLQIKVTEESRAFSWYCFLWCTRQFEF